MKSITFVAAVCLAMTLALPNAARAHGDPGRPDNALVGTWSLVVTFSDGLQVNSTLTVVPGRRDGEGSVIHSAAASLLLPTPATPEQGVWAHTRGRRFVAAYQSYTVDGTFQVPAGRVGFRHSLRLGADLDTLSGEAIFEVIDTSGVVVFSDRVQTTGTRQRLQE